MIGDQGGFDAVALQRYHWVEQIDHVHHAGNSSGIVDGAALTLIGTEAAGRPPGSPRGPGSCPPRSRRRPDDHAHRPRPGQPQGAGQGRADVDDIDLFEINEAFAAVALRFMRDLDLDHEKVNVNGGAIAMGHPLGATGAMILGTLIDELERRDLRYGLATLCVGGGMGIATVVERV
jgi:acetyl-CoA C-acetyltransferase